MQHGKDEDPDKGPDRVAVIRHQQEPEACENDRKIDEQSERLQAIKIAAESIGDVLLEENAKPGLVPGPLPQPVAAARIEAVGGGGIKFLIGLRGCMLAQLSGKKGLIFHFGNSVDCPIAMT